MGGGRNASPAMKTKYSQHLSTESKRWNLKVWTVGPALSSSQFYTPVAHKRFAPASSKFDPRVAHKSYAPLEWQLRPLNSTAWWLTEGMHR